MFDFSDDETVFMIVAAVVAVAAMLVYLIPLGRIFAPRTSMSVRFGLGVWPLVCLLPTWIVLQRWADPQVVGHPDYELLFLIGAAAWVLLAAVAMPLLGISAHGDAIERSNRPAALAAMAWMLAVGVVYAAANIGAGPTIWTTLGPAAAGTLSLAVLMMFAGTAEAITIERDASAARMFSLEVLLLAAVFAYAVAGDFKSWGETWSTFGRCGMPAAGIAAGFTLLNRVRSFTR